MRIKQIGKYQTNAIQISRNARKFHLNHQTSDELSEIGEDELHEFYCISTKKKKKATEIVISKSVFFLI